MSAPRIDMHRLQELVRLCRLGTGVRERARLLGMSTRTEREYRRLIEAAGLLDGEPGDLPEEELLQAAVASARPTPTRWLGPTTVDPWLPAIEAGMARGAGAQAIWDKLRREDADFQSSLSAVKRAVQRLRRERGVMPEDVVIRVETDPGDVAQVDFGYAGRFFDSTTGRVRKAWVFVMVLGFSRHMFARLVFDQKATTWIALHVEAFRWFGGVPATIVPDNLKAAVVRAAFGAGDRHLLALNRTYRELARYYGFKVDPTPVASPEKKGKSESAVKYTVRNYLVAGGFETIEDANAGLPDWLMKTAGMRNHGTTHRRPLELFEIERHALIPLPAVQYEAVEWRQATVHRDCHIEFDRRLYSVPWPYIGVAVWVKATPSSVMIYANHERIATHQRRQAGRWSTQLAHLPEHRGRLAQRSIDYWLEVADRMDPAVGAYARNVIASDSVISKLRDVQSIVSHLEQFPVRRARAACLRADYFGNYTYQGVRRILDQALDLVPLPCDTAETFGVLSEPRFARRTPFLTSIQTESTRDCDH